MTITPKDAETLIGDVILIWPLNAPFNDVHKAWLRSAFQSYALHLEIEFKKKYEGEVEKN